MLDRIILVGLRTLEIMFFVGAVGCVITIVASWVQIFAEGFNDDKSSQTDSSRITDK